MDTVLIVLIAAYFGPTLIALLRGHHNALAIFVLNLLLGWTVLGWIIAFVWSCTVVLRPVIGPPERPLFDGEIAAGWHALPRRQRYVVVGVSTPILIVALIVLLLII